MELRSGRLIREKCGRPLVQGKLNMDAWLVNIKCGGDCHKAGAHYQMSCFVIYFSLQKEFVTMSHTKMTLIMYPRPD